MNQDNIKTWNEMNSIALEIAENITKYAKADAYGKEKWRQIDIYVYWGLSISKHRETLKFFPVVKVQEWIARRVYSKARRDYPKYYEEIRRSEMELLDVL